MSILTGSDESQEWLLPWFYDHFRKYNPEVPIAFADFGMSLQAKKWCEERGTLFEVPEILTSKSPFQEWKLDMARIERRWVCFRKPLALVRSPFQRTLWLDLDCEVRGDLTSFLTMSLPEKFAVSPCNSYIHVKEGERLFLIDKYNTGVILFDRDSELISDWARNINRNSFHTDEGSLSLLIHQSKKPIKDLPWEYNWPLQRGENKEALIYHWHGSEMKQKLFLKLNF